MFGGLLLEARKQIYQPLVRAFCFLVIWVLGIILISHVLFHLSYVFLYWFFAAVYTFILCYVFCSFIEHVSIWSLGLKVRGKSMLSFVSGILLGFIMITAVFLTEISLGVIYIELNSKVKVSYLIYGLLASLSVAFMEELVFRGYLFRNVALSLNENSAILVSSIVFGLMHVFNPNVNFLAIIVISIVGVLLAISYLKTQELYFPIGLHFAWNFFEGYIYGFPISGSKVEGVLVINTKGSTWLTGGNFGPEGGLIGLIVSLTTTLIAFFLYKLKTRKR